MRNSYVYLLSILLLFLSGCGRITVNKNWKTVQTDVLHRTGYSVDFELADKQDTSVDNELITKENSIAIALKSNPELHAQFQELGIAKADLVQAGLYRNPDFASAINFPKCRDDTSEVEIGLSFSLADAWQLPVRKKVSSYHLEVISLMIIDTIVTVIAQVEQAYINCNYLQKVLKKITELYDESTFLVDQLTYRQQFGLQSDLNIHLAQSVSDQQYAHLIEAQNNLAIAYSNFKKLLGLTPTLVPIEIQDTITDLFNLTLGYDQLYTYAMQRPDILAAEYRIKQFEKLIELERRKFIDNFSIGFSYAKDFERSKGIGPLLALELPIFDMNQAQVARAQFGLAQAQKNLKAKTLEATHMLNTEFANYNAAQKRITVLTSAVIEQKKAVEYTYQYFPTMQLPLTILIETRISLLDVELQLLKAHYDLYGAYINIQKIIGRRLDETYDCNAIE